MFIIFLIIAKGWKITQHAFDKSTLQVRENLKETDEALH